VQQLHEQVHGVVVGEVGGEVHGAVRGVHAMGDDCMDLSMTAFEWLSRFRSCYSFGKSPTPRPTSSFFRIC
jgi:hypothetical protein